MRANHQLLLTTPLYLLTACIISLTSAAGGREPTFATIGEDISACPSRTINYITQILPQQCLTASWSSQASAALVVEGVEQEETLVTPSTNSYTNDNGISVGLTSSPPTVPIPPNLSESECDVAPTSAPSTKKDSSTQLKSVEDDHDGDPLSDNAIFLSYEEWKAQMLKKAGQSPDTVGNGRVGAERADVRRRPSQINNALDSLGDDTEIELDFGGFVGSDVQSITAPPRKLHREGQIEHTVEDRSREERSRDGSMRRKDAGTTCKERFNYASFDCAATVLKTNQECKGSTSVLVENKDNYMLNKCSANNKFFIVELCNDILIDTVVLANFEFFSSTFRTFRASISDRYPVKNDQWRELGVFEARNTREIQPFLVENALIWARYLRIEFLTHYGNEYYCPVSLLRIHGKTMMDDYRNDFKAARSEDEFNEEVAEAINETQDIQNSDVAAKESVKATVITISEETTETPSPASHNTQTRIASMEAPSVPEITTGHIISSQWKNASALALYRSPLEQEEELTISFYVANGTLSDVEVAQVLELIECAIERMNNFSVTEMLPPSSVLDATTTTLQQTRIGFDESAIRQTTPPSQVTSSTQTNSKDNMTTATPSSAKSQSNQTPPTSRVLNQQPSPAPPTQESFFKLVHKRLQLLELNSTLSLQYIEEQSRILREAFTKVEKRQLSKTTTFLENLNVTVLSELRGFRLQYDQIWQSTVLELSSQREKSQREVIALSARLGVLADEILFQKRIAILQFILILFCLGLVIFSRSTAGSHASYLDLPDAVHNIISRPSNSFSRYLSLDSPPETDSRPTSRYGLFSRLSNHVRSPSDESTLHEDMTKNPLPDVEGLRVLKQPPVAMRRAASNPTISADLREQLKALIETGTVSHPLDHNPIVGIEDGDYNTEVIGDHTKLQGPAATSSLTPRSNDEIDEGGFQDYDVDDQGTALEIANATAVR